MTTLIPLNVGVAAFPGSWRTWWFGAVTVSA
jgi:hypothetical protein